MIFALRTPAVREVSGLLLRLNMSTSRWHADVDETWLQLMRPSVSRADYLAQLVRTYGFVAPLESACRYTPALGGLIELAHFSRAGLIARDILTLGLSPAQVSTIAQCPITPFKDLHEALGWLYVVERATLLQDGIKRHLLGHLPELAHACSYLSAFDGRVGEHWANFGDTLDRAVAGRPGLADEIVAASHEGFRLVLDWFKHPHSVRATRHIG